MKKKSLDPEQERFYRKYPKFIGVKKSIELLQSRNVRGTFVEGIMHELEKRADDILPEVVEAFWRERDTRTRNLLIHVLGAASDEMAVKTLAEALKDPDEEVALTAESELGFMDSKSARRVLGETRSRRR